jgi:hypothetical protein
MARMTKIEDLHIGDRLLLPFATSATVRGIRPFGPRTQYIHIRTEHGWTRVFRRSHVWVAEREDET